MHVSPRLVALVLVTVMVLPGLSELQSTRDASAQGNLDGLIPTGIGWQDWQADHKLFAHPRGTDDACPQDPATGSASLPGDRLCQLPMDTTEPTSATAQFITKSIDSDLTPPQDPGTAPDTERAFVRLNPQLAHPLRVNSLKGELYATFQPQPTTCEGVFEATGQVFYTVEVRALPSGDAGTSPNSGQRLGSAQRRFCPVDEGPGPVYKIPVPAIPLVSPEVSLLDGQKLQFIISFTRPNIPGTYQLHYGSNAGRTHLSVSSPDAFQFATWMTDHNDRITTVFSIPTNPADRFSAIGFFAFKTSFGGYDNPRPPGSAPATNDSKWSMRIRGPDGNVIDLTDPVYHPPHNASVPHEFPLCDDQTAPPVRRSTSDQETCLVQFNSNAQGPGDRPSARVFRMPERPTSAGSNHVWNYTQARMTQIAPNGGVFRLEIRGSVRDAAIDTRLPGGLPFTVGGVGVGLAPLQAGNAVEQLSRQVRPGLGRTFLLNITNLGSEADNLTLTSQVITASPAGSTWNVAFGGRPVIGTNTAFLFGLNASVLKVTVTPPADLAGGAATVRVTATSLRDPTKNAQVDLTLQISSTLTRGVGTFLFPDAAQKTIRRGETTTFNYTVWNTGTDTDTFNVNCDQGPDLGVGPDGRRIDDSWNGIISVAGTAIGCRDVNATRFLIPTIAPGNTIEAQVTLQASLNNTGRSITVSVRAQSQQDTSRVASAVAVANVELRASFQLQILTDGTADPDNPQNNVRSTRVLRFGKDNPTQCPNPTAPERACTGDTEHLLPGDWDRTPVATQRLDTNFTEFAYYRLTIINDGDLEGHYDLRMTEVRNRTLASCAGIDSFSAVSMSTTGESATDIGHGDARGIVLLRRPLLFQEFNVETDTVSTLTIPPGKQGVFYLRVHHEWNRSNLTILGAPEGPGGGGALGEVCDSVQTAVIQVTQQEAPNPRRTVTAETRALNRAPDDNTYPRSVVITQGLRQSDNSFEADVRQVCPPVTPENSPDRLYCKYIRPGTINPDCQCSVSWFFTASKFLPRGDDFQLRPLRRAGGLNLQDLVNRGWRFVGPTALEPSRVANAAGDEVAVRVDVTVPGNATISDFAGLDLTVCAARTSICPVQPFSFFTVGAQKFKVSLTNLACAPGEAICEQVIHPGDKAAVNLNISNEGAAAQTYNITLVTSLAQGWGVSFQPNETRVSPSTNKTATVFIIPPTVGQFPQTQEGRIRAAVLKRENASEVQGETFAEVRFRVVVQQRGAEDLDMKVWNPVTNTLGAEERPITPSDPGGASLTFTLNLTNPAPNEKKVSLSRLPPANVRPQFVDGWLDQVGESCFDIASRSSKLVTFRITAAHDALEGTHVSYVLRAEEATSDGAGGCRVAPNTQNFAQAIVTATVIGRVGLSVEPLEPSKVVPRGGNASFPVLVRNIGTAGDTFFFQTTFNNQSQTLAPNAWTAEVRSREGTATQATFVDPQTSKIVFVNVQAPLNIPFRSVRSDIDFVVRGAGVASPATRLQAFVQDYDLRIRLPNATVDAIPGQTHFFVLNITNLGNGIDTVDINADVGTLSGIWNVTTEFSRITLLNGTSKDIQVNVQVPRRPLPTVGVIIGMNVRSPQLEALRRAAEEQVGSGSPLAALLNDMTPRPAAIQVNLLPYVQFDIDGDKEPEIAVDRNRDQRDGFELFVDPFTDIRQSVDLLAADGDGDGRIDHFIDTNLRGRPDKYWDPDNGFVNDIGCPRSTQVCYPDVNNDGALEFLYDADNDLQIDHWIDPATRRTGEVIEKDFNDDGSPEFIIDTNGDGRPDRYYDPSRGPRGLVTLVEPSFGGNPQRYGIDTTGGGRPTKVYDRVTGEVFDARVSGIAEFVSSFWYLVLLFLAVAILATYLVVQRRRQGREPPPT